MDEKELVIILSDIHMGNDSPTVSYCKDVHESYLIEILNDIIACANHIKELVLLGDIFEFWSYPPDELPPTLDDIIATHPNILGPNGKLSQTLSALKGRIVFIPGDHDMNVTEEDLNKIKNSDGYTIRYHSGAYIPSYDTSILFTHGNEFCLLDAPYYRSNITPLPLGYFLSRAISYRLEKKLSKTHGKTVANLKGNVVQSITDFIFKNLSFHTSYRNDPYFVRKLIDSIVYTTGIPRNQYIKINKTTMVSLNDIEEIYEGLLDEFVEKLNKQIYSEQINYIKSLTTDFNGAFLPYLAKKYAIEKGTNSVIVGHTHVPISPVNNGVLQYANTGFMCPSVSDMQTNPITFGIYNCSNRLISLMNVSCDSQKYLQSYISNTRIANCEDLFKSTSSANNMNHTKILQNTPNVSTPTSQFTFGWSVYDASWEYFRTMQDGVLSKANELGISVITHDQRSDTIEMVVGCINLIIQNVNALLISPYNPEVVPFIVSNANSKGIPVVIIDGGTGGADVLAFIVSDSFAGGILAGEYALSLINKYSLQSNNVAIIKAEATAIYALRRGQGFKSVMIGSGYQVVSEVSANGLEELAYIEMKIILESYGDDLAVVFCENGNMTLGAAQAIEESGKKGKIMLIGFDADPSVLDAIQQGLVQGTIAQQPYKMGEIGVETAYEALLGIPILYDNWMTKEILMEVYLIDESGNPSITLK